MKFLDLPFLCLLTLQLTSCFQETTGDKGQPNVYCVVTNSSQSNSTCHTLKYYMNSSLSFLNETCTTFIFYPGIHLTDSNTSLQLSNLSRLILKGQNAVIQCNQQNNIFRFQYVQHLVIEGLNFSQCGYSSTNERNGYPTLWFSYINATLVLADIVISRSEYQGLLVINSTGYISISDSTLEGCQTDKYNKVDKRPANAIYFSSCQDKSTLVVTSTTLLRNKNSIVKKPDTPLDYPFAAGLTIVIHCPNVTVTLDDVIADGNSGGDGRNLAFIFHTSDLNKVPPVIVNNSHIRNGLAMEGGGVFASLVQPVLLNTSYNKQNSGNTHTILHIENTRFENNSAYFLGGAIGIRQKESSTSLYVGDIIINNCTFRKNSLKEGGHGGTAITSINFIVTEVERRISPQFKTIITNSLFYHNYVYKNKRKSAGTAVIFVKTNPYFQLCDIAIDSNNSTAILGLQSNLVLGGTITISHNKAESGGGMLLCQNAILYFESALQLEIYNNSAKHTGGGIAVESLCMVSKPICFFQLASSSSSHGYNNISVTIHNNTAKHAGDNLYGGSVDYCYLIENSAHNTPANKSLPVFYEIFDIYPNGSGLPYITSPPDHVCICDNNSANCNVSEYYYPTSVYPGEPFNIMIILAGQLNGSVPGLVEAELERKNPNTSLLKDLRVKKLTHSHCKSLSYTINANQTEINITMAISAAQQGDISVTEYLPQYRPLKVIISISDCPKGFTVSFDDMICICEPIFSHATEYCDIKHQTILVLENSWIGYTSDSDSSVSEGLYVVTDHCPPEYCNPGRSFVNTSLTEFNENTQCQAHRRGIMCGQCEPGYSSMFGGTSCTRCSNKWLFMIVVYAFAGISLVFALTFFDITVADGTINGLIFYANIIQAHYPTLFNVEGRDQWLTTVLTIFTGWISFENGVEKCFYDGMTEYSKAWIQFIFPFYIWLILGLIVLLSRRYIIVTRITGTNAVKVLATLILLSYSKFLLSIIAGFDYTLVFLSNGDKQLVWTKDGSIHFFGKKHLLLLIFSICLLIVLIPYTISLLFIQVLERLSHCRVFFLIRKLKPLLDAYTGPYADNARFWTGFLLLIRIIIFTTSTLTGRLNVITNISCTTALLVIVLTTALFLRNGIYKQGAIQLLEGFLLLNLTLVFVATDFAHSQKKDQTPYSQFFVGMAFLTFVLVISYHIFRKVYTISLVRRCILTARSRVKSRAQYERIEPQENLNTRRDLPSVVKFTEAREPLLDSRSEMQCTVNKFLV